MKRSATITPDGLHRLSLTRGWDSTLPTCAFIMLNPSTADATQDDATIRRCIQFAKNWGYGSLLVLNLFTYRATDPEELRGLSPADLTHGDFTDNFFCLVDVVSRGGIVVAAWGNKGIYLGASNSFKLWCKEKDIPLSALKITKTGEPSHPLYLKKDLTPVPYKLQGE